MKTNDYFFAALFFAISCTVGFAQSTWTQKADYISTASRSSATGFSIGNKGYIATVSQYDSTKKELWEWNSSIGIWTQKANLGGTARENVVGFSIGTKGYILTGSQNDFWEYDQGTDTWIQKANFPGVARESVVGFSIGTKGYIGTGLYVDGFNVYVTKEFWEWNQVTDTWVKKADFGGDARAGAVGFSLGNKGYIGTGAANGTGARKRDFWEWDQLTDTWSQKSDFGGSARSQAVGFSIGTKGYIGTGDSIGINYKDFWEWDQATDAWVKKTDFGGNVRYDAVGFSIETKGYIAMGLDFGPVSYNDFWEYSPQMSGIIKNDFASNSIIYPNPSNGKFILISSINIGDITIYNALGEKIYFSKINQQTTNQIDLSQSPKGTYFVKIYDGEKIHTEKMVIQ